VCHRWTRRSVASRGVVILAILKFVRGFCTNFPDIGIEREGLDGIIVFLSIVVVSSRLIHFVMIPKMNTSSTPRSLC
jgi:hypothetical protein